MPVAVYCRVSSEEQAERGTIEIQKEFAAKYVDLYQLEVFDYYCDDGISGTIPVEARPEGSRLFRDAKEKKFDTILFYKIDRLGRKVRVILNAVHDLEELGVSIRSMTEPLETETPTGRFMLTSLAGISELEHDTILSRMWAGSQRAARLGNWLGGIVPFGYHVVDKQLQISDDIMPGCNLSEADVIQLIFDLSGNQKMSAIKISDYLNALNIPTRYDLNGINGKRKKNASSIWYPSRVLSIIKSTTYKGTHKYGKRATNKNSKIILRPVPAIVSDELWEKANEALKTNQITAMRNAVREYLLRGIIKCGNCGRTYMGTAYSGSGREKIPYYVCNAKNSYLAHNTEKCISKNVRADWLEHLVLEDCIKILKSPNKILNMDPEKEQQSLADEVKKEHDQIKASLKKLSEERASIIELYRKKIISETDLSCQLEKLSTEEATLQERLKMKIDSRKSAATKQNKEKAISLLKKFTDKCQNLDPEKLSFETKRAIIELIVEKITVTTESAPEKYYPEISVDIEYRFATTPNHIAYVEDCTVTGSALCT